MTDTTLGTTTTPESLRAEVQQFYAHHMHLLDAGRAEEWADTFTDDAVFAPEHRPEPVVGRRALAAALRASRDELAAVGEVRRHWHGMVAITPGPDDTLHVQCYALIVGTLPGAAPEVRMSCVCRDLLVRGADGTLRVARRTVTRDGAGAPR